MQVRIINTRIDCTQKPVPRNFGIQVTSTEILVPEELVEQLGGTNNVQTPEELVSVINAFPSVLVALFQAPVAEVNKTKRELFKELQGIVSEEHLYPPTPPKFTCGAFGPLSLP